MLTGQGAYSGQGVTVPSPTSSGEGTESQVKSLAQGHTGRKEVVGIDLNLGLSITRTRFITTILSCLQKGCSAVLQIPRSLMSCLKLRIA